MSAATPRVITGAASIDAMSPERFRTILLLLGEEGKPISHREAGELFGKSPRQIRNYLNGVTDIHPLVAEKAMRLYRWAAEGEDWRKRAHQERELATRG